MYLCVHDSCMCRFAMLKVEVKGICEECVAKGIVRLCLSVCHASHVTLHVI